MSYRFFNPNPLGKFVGGCTIRAICAVTGLDWYEIHSQQSDLSRIMADMPSSDDVWWELLRLHGFRKVKLLDSCPDCYTVADFAYDHPSGLYVLGPKEHAEITQIKDKKEVLEAFVEAGTSRMFMTDAHAA